MSQISSIEKTAAQYAGRQEDFTEVRRKLATKIYLLLYLSRERYLEWIKC